MIMIAVKCPVCGGTNISKMAKVQKVLNDNDCICKSFMLEYIYNGWKPGINKNIINMTANASGIRDIARVLEISKQKSLIR